MTDEVLREMARLLDAVRGRIGHHEPAGDVWSAATRDEEPPHIATGAPECLYCPICRTIAAARGSGPDLAGQVLAAGQAMMAAVRDAVASHDRSRTAPHRDEDPMDIG